MKLSKSIIIIIVILSFLINSNVVASKISYDGKVSNFSYKRLNEREKLSNADLLIQDRFNCKESIKNDSIIVENNSQKSEPLKNDTITLYAYPSSYLTDLSYKLYKCTWSKKILDNVIWDEFKASHSGADKNFDIPYDVIQKSRYLDVIRTAYNGYTFKYDTVVTHHITLSDEFKQNIPSKITFHLGWYEPNKVVLYFNCHRGVQIEVQLILLIGLLKNEYKKIKCLICLKK